MTNIDLTIAFTPGLTMTPGAHLNATEEEHVRNDWHAYGQTDLPQDGDKTWTIAFVHLIDGIPTTTRILHLPRSTSDAPAVRQAVEHPQFDVIDGDAPDLIDMASPLIQGAGIHIPGHYFTPTHDMAVAA